MQEPTPMHAGAGVPVVHDTRELRKLIAGTHFNDVSEFQVVDWAAYGAARSIAIARTAFGTYKQDAQWGNNLPGMRAHVKYRGFYLFLCADQDPIAQADYHCSLIGSYQAGEFSMLDWENYSPTGGWPSQAQAEAFCNRVDQNLGGVTWVYSDGSHAIANRPKITASYGFSEPGDSHTAWQHTDGALADLGCMPAPGIGYCDCNVTHLTLDQIAGLTFGGTAKAAEVPIFSSDA